MLTARTPTVAFACALLSFCLRGKYIDYQDKENFKRAYIPVLNAGADQKIKEGVSLWWKAVSDMPRLRHLKVGENLILQPGTVSLDADEGVLSGLRVEEIFNAIQTLARDVETAQLITNFLQQTWVTIMCNSVLGIRAEERATKTAHQLDHQHTIQIHRDAGDFRITHEILFAVNDLPKSGIRNDEEQVDEITYVKSQLTISGLLSDLKQKYISKIDIKISNQIAKFQS